jgi:hypothetical protein
MSDDLVRRLRVDDPWCQPKCNDAADRIEELEAKLAKSEAEKFTVGALTMKHVFCPSGLTNVSDMQAVFDATERGFEELEAKLAKAVEALSTALDEMVDYADTHPAWSEIWEAREGARTTLAELTGGKDD